MTVALSTTAKPCDEFASAADFTVCQAWIARHSRSFYLSSLLLPGPVRREAWALYAFCRRADDAVDEVSPSLHGDLGGLVRVAALRRRLDRVYEGRLGQGSGEAVDRAFAQVVARTALPRAVPEQLLDGMEMDARGTEYHTSQDLLRYCFNVAATVGLMMTAVMGHRGPPERNAEVLMRAAELGVAMQLTNILRDVGEDGRRGRVYLPRDLLARHHTSQGEVLALCAAGRPPSLALRAALRDLRDQADAFYLSADRGVPFLPRDCQLAIRSARLIYAGILDQVARRGYDSITRRAVVPVPIKLLLVLRALVSPILSSVLSPTPRLTLAAAGAAPGPADDQILRLLRKAKVVPPPDEEESDVGVRAEALP